MADRTPFQYPDWPAVMPEEMAARYVSVSPTTFRKQIMPQVPPKRLTDKRVGWRRADLDAWVARDDVSTATSETVNTWDRSLDRARQENGKKATR